MSNIVSISQDQTMTSREIAELTGKDLSNVHRDIRAMLDELKKDDSNLNHPREDKDSRGYTTCFHLSRELTETLLTGYSASARLKVIRRWHELEAEKASDGFKIPQTMAEALRLAADQQEQIETQQLQIKRAAPKVELVDNFLRAGDGKTGEVVAKELAKEFDIGRNRMYAFLKAKGIFNGDNVPRQCHIDAGRFYLQPTTYETEHGRHQSTSVRFTAKGEFHVRALLQKEGYAKRIAA